MGWFHEWWLSLGLAGQIMACAAIPMTIVMLLQLVLMIIGAGFDGETDGGGGADTDAGVDIDAGADVDAGAGMDVDASVGTDVGGIDSAPGSTAHAEIHSDKASFLKIFTIRGIVAFFALGGWAGLAALTAGIPVLWSIQIAIVSGTAALILASVAIRFAIRMQSSGNLDMRNALLQTAEVYITIPPKRKTTGKVTMTLQERFVELEAVTDSETAIKPREMVKVIGITDKTCLVVSPIAEKTKED